MASFWCSFVQYVCFQICFFLNMPYAYWKTPKIRFYKVLRVKVSSKKTKCSRRYLPIIHRVFATVREVAVSCHCMWHMHCANFSVNFREIFIVQQYRCGNNECTKYKYLLMLEMWHRFNASCIIFITEQWHEHWKWNTQTVRSRCRQQTADNSPAGVITNVSVLSGRHG